MVREEMEPLVNWITARKGFVSGGLVAGGLLEHLDPIIQAALIALGVFIFFECIIPSTEHAYVVVAIGFWFLGGFVAAGLTALKLALPYLVLIVIAALYFYFRRFLSGH